MKKEEILKALSAPFTMTTESGEVMPAHKWKAQTTKGDGAVCVPYIDARQVASRLNEVLGIDSWSDTLIETGESALICELTIVIDGQEVTRSNIGVKSEYAQQKGMASDAFKRAAAMFGVGAYLYEMQPVKLAKVTKNGKIFPATADGIALVTGDELTSYINLKNPLRAKLIEIFNSLSAENQKAYSAKFTELWNLIS